MRDERLASCDLFVTAHYAMRLLAKLRAVAPDLVAAAEEELERGL